MRVEETRESGCEVACESSLPDSAVLEIVNFLFEQNSRRGFDDEKGKFISNSHTQHRFSISISCLLLNRNNCTASSVNI